VSAAWRIGIATVLGLLAAAAAVTIAASCAFMLPVATPPNVIVFGTERVPQSMMMRCDWWLNLACIVAVSGFTLLLLRLA
jgi:sodium-dependent dicarboxylate transporter 2/3/5